MHRIRRTYWTLAVAGIFGLAMLLGSRPASLQAQAPGTQPIPANIGWDQESLNALNAINTFRAQQQPPLVPLQVEATLQYAAAWEVNDQMTNGQCFGQSGNPQGAGYYPYAPLTTNPAAICPHTDSLGRDPFARFTTFGYTGGGGENANFGGGDNTPASIAQGQNAYKGWYDLEDPDANGVPTYAHRKAMISPGWTVMGIARQCDTFVHRCFWAADFGTCLMMPFAPPTGPTPPTAPAPPPACQGAGTVTLPPATLQPTTPPTFTGTWAVDKFDSGVGGTLTLAQTGNQVTGTYAFADPSGCGNATGTFTGSTSGTGDLLTYSSNDSGCGAPNRYSGSQIRLSGGGQSFTGGTRWNGKLCGGTAPACPVLAAATNQPTTTTTTTQPATTTTQPTTGPTTVTQPTTTTTVTQPTTGPTTVTQPTTTTTVTQPTTTTTVTQPTTGPTTVTQPTITTTITQPTTGPTTITQPTVTTTITQPTAAAAGAGWAGNWNTDFGPIPLTLTGNQVSGANNYVDSNNVPTTLSVNGTANGNTLAGTFGITPPTPAFGGTMTFTLSADGQSFTGTYTLPGNNTGTWNGTRTGP